MKYIYQSVSLHSRRFFSGIMLSRISGMIRDLVMASIFGDHPSVAAFMVSFRLSNLLRRLTGEGPFQTAFTPHYEGLRLESPQRAVFFFRKLVFLITIFLIFIVIIIEIGTTFSLNLFDLSEPNKEILVLMRWLFPSIIFICLYGLNLSFLHCNDSFFISGFAPFICNAMWILGILYVKNQSVPLAMPTLAKFVLIGFIGQWVITLPLTLKNISAPLKEWCCFKIPLEVKKLFTAFSLGAIGVGAVQINAFLDSLFARYINLRGPAYLWYSIRIQQLALAIFGIVCISTVIPRLCRAIKVGNLTEAQGLFSFSYKRVIIIMIPCTFAIITLGSSASNLIFGRGFFSDIGISKTILCLWAYGIGLFPTTMILLLSAVFYSHNNFRIPTIVSVISIIINIAINSILVLIFKLGIFSIALGTSISAWLNFLILRKLSKSLEMKRNYSNLRIYQICLICIFSLITSIIADHFLLNSTILPLFLNRIVIFNRSLFIQLPQFVFQFLFFVISLCVFSIIFKNHDILEFLYEFFLKKNFISKEKMVDKYFDVDTKL